MSAAVAVLPAPSEYEYPERTMSTHTISRLLCLAIAWIPAASASAGALEWNTLLETASGPPYPTTGSVQFGLGEGLLLPAVQRSRIQVGLDSVFGDGSVMPATLLGGDSGAGGAAGPRASLSLSLGGPIASNLNMDLLIAAFGDGSVRQGAVLQDFHFNQGAFDLMFDVFEADGSVHKHAWHGSIASGQPFGIGKGAAIALGDGSVRLLLDLNRLPGNQILSEPVVAMSMTAALVPEQATVLLLGLGALLLRRRTRA
jgi:hypothetical protein